MRRSLLPGLLTLCVAGSAGLACSTGDVASPGAVLPNPRVGATPLRRLSNVEYLNALSDLFSAAHPVLPALPPDIPVAGFENAAEAQRPSDVLTARYEAIANLYADAVTRDPGSVRALAGCTDWSMPALATACASSFFATTGRRIFRRPLTEEERARLLLRFEGWQAAVDFEGAVQLSLSGTDVDRTFEGAVDLSHALAESETVHACATAELVRYALGRAPSNDELPAVASFTKGLMASRGDLRALLVEIATSPSFRLRLVDPEPTR